MYFTQSDTCFAPLSGPFRPGDVILEPYAFTCLACGDRWERDYEVICRMGNLAVDREVFTVDGEVVPPPTAPRRCANCDSAEVRAEPTRPATVAHDLPVPRRRLRGLGRGRR